MMILGKILLIDDDSFCNRMHKHMVERQKAAESILTFELAEDALKYLHQLALKGEADEFPNLILLDLHMSFMDGWHFLEEYNHIKEEYREKVKIFILTSSIMEEDRQAAESHPSVDGFLVKPLSEAEIVYILSEYFP